MRSSYIALLILFMLVGASPTGYTDTSTVTTSVTTYTQTTSVSYTTTTTTYSLTIYTVETTSTTTSVTATYSSTTWESITLLTTATVQLTSWFTETSSTTVTQVQTSTLLSPTVTVPTTKVTSTSTTIYSPTTTLTSTTSTGTTTTITSTYTTTTTIDSPTVTLSSTTRIVTTIIPPEAFRRCIIASAAHGSEFAEPVQSLREFRDQQIGSSFAGAQFLTTFERFYYSFSPTLAPVIASSQPFAAIVRLIMYPLLSILQASSAIFNVFDFAPEVGTVVAGVFNSALLGVVYLTPFAYGTQCLLKKKSNTNRSVILSLARLNKSKRNQPLDGMSQ